MRIQVIFLFLIGLITNAHAQYNLYNADADTLKFNFRSSGLTIDSVDIMHSEKISTLPWIVNPFGQFQNDYTGFTNFLQGKSEFKPLTNYFTALPHFGFSYSFGSSGTQFMNLDYQQSFRNNTNLGFLYNRSKSNNLLRNNTSEVNNIQFLLNHSRKKYENLVFMNFHTWKQNYSFGIQSDSLIETLDLIYLPVNRENASRDHKKFELGTQHILYFLNDSIKSLGLSYRNAIKINNNRFSDFGNLGNFYNQTLISSDSTNDQRQISSLANSLGITTKYKKVILNAELEHNYWRFSNLSHNRDTNEISLNILGKYQSENLSILNQFSQNIIGAQGGIQNKLELNFRLMNILSVLKFEFSNALIDPILRSYYSNHYTWKIDNKKQTQIKVVYQLSSSNKYIPTVNLKHRTSKNYFYFDGINWLQNSNPFSITSLQISQKYSWKTLSVTPNLTYNISNMDEIPSYDLRARLMFNKKLFKAKKFNFYFATDFKYINNYKLSMYNPVLNLYTFQPNSSAEFQRQLDLDIMTGFEIDKFRFFVKYENLSYLWNDKTNNIQMNYPIMPNIFRIGMTFDFVN